MVLDLKAPSVDVKHPIEGVHGQALRLPEAPGLEFRVIIGSLTGPDLGCFCFEIYDFQGVRRGSLGSTGTLRREDSDSGMPTNYNQAIEYIRKHYKRGLSSQCQTP